MLLFLATGLFETGVDKLIDKEILPVVMNQVWDSHGCSMIPAPSVRWSPRSRIIACIRLA
ncbi:MAG: High-affinity Fe2+/Pb2+ permease [uncultured Caballeronia sp.]|nr:MAG: High-affinity Fe2+/Pb2+ permease [uncultured Caballeronia sp.]